MASRKDEMSTLKNLLVVCIGFLLLFCAYQSLANLQSTLNMEEGIGIASQSIIYAALIVSSLFLPDLLIRKIGCKWTLVLSIATYCPYVAANFSTQMATFVPTSILLGLGGAPLWCAKCTYLNLLAVRYSERIKETVQITISRFFGIFFAIFQSTQIWGNLISYYVLRPANGTTLDVTQHDCGIDFCDVTSNSTNPNLLPPSEDKRFMLIGIYLSCAVLAALIIAVFLDPLETEPKKGSKVLDSLAATFKHLCTIRQLLLVPLTIFSGIEQAFFLSDFTLAFVACSWGVYHVGYVFMCYGATNVVMSFVSGRLVQWIPRPVIFGSAFVANLVACATMFLWSPKAEQSFVFLLIAGVWGMSDAVWQSQINALYGTLFIGQETAAFANYRLWESLGFLMTFAYGKAFCTNTKLYILLGFAFVGILGYFVVEAKGNESQKTVDESVEIHKNHKTSELKSASTPYANGYI